MVTIQIHIGWIFFGLTILGSIFYLAIIKAYEKGFLRSKEFYDEIFTKRGK